MCVIDGTEKMATQRHVKFAICSTIFFLIWALWNSFQDTPFNSCSGESHQVRCKVSNDMTRSTEKYTLTSNSKDNDKSITGNTVDLKVETPSDAPVDYARECPGMRFDVEIAAEGSMPLIALASFPRSGNTWSRLLLQIATKLSTGSVYWEFERKDSYAKKAFPAAAEDYHRRTAVCVKTHHYYKEQIAEFSDGVILLIRNPYKSILSEFFRQNIYDKGLTEEQSFQQLLQPPWKRGYFVTFSERWRDLNLAWITHSKRLLIVHYEDLIDNTMYQLTRMIEFMKQPLQLHRMQCALMHYATNDSINSYVSFDPYTPVMREKLDMFIKEVNDTLIGKGETPLPTYHDFQ